MTTSTHNEPPLWELSAARYYWRHVASPEFRAKVEQLFKQGEAVQVLWMCRESYASNLKHAKEAVREWREELGIEETDAEAGALTPVDKIAVVWYTDVTHESHFRWLWRLISKPGSICISFDLYINDANVITAGYAVSIEELHTSTVRDGQFEIFTCGCGDAGCAGLSAVEVVYFGDKVLWNDTTFLGGKYVFDGRSYREQISRAYQDAAESFAKLR